MRIEAVTVCVQYDDFLAQTAPLNRGLFDRWIIVTKPGDKATRQVARKFNLEVVLTDDFTRDGAEFGKARGINRGLEQLSADCWHMHIDGDIVLPSNLRLLLEASHLHEDCIYGWDRFNVCGWKEWQRVLHSGQVWSHHDYHYRVQPPNLPLMTRWVSPYYGYCPIGWCQLWHSSADQWSGIRQRRYPERHGNAARSDVQFALLWDRQKRVHLPEVVAWHLESEPSKTGRNWNGRTTQRFGPGLTRGAVAY